MTNIRISGDQLYIMKKKDLSVIIFMVFVYYILRKDVRSKYCQNVQYCLVCNKDYKVKSMLHFEKIRNNIICQFLLLMFIAIDYYANFEVSNKILA